MSEAESDPFCDGTVDVINQILIDGVRKARAYELATEERRTHPLSAATMSVAEVVRKFGQLRVQRCEVLDGNAAYSDGQLLVLSAELFDRLKGLSPLEVELEMSVIPCRYFPLTQAMSFAR